MTQDSAPDRLVQATFSLLSQRGVHGVTARAVGDLSGLMASAVNYHFGGRDGLLTAAFQQAHDQATAWRDRWRVEGATRPPGKAFPVWFATALDDYGFDQAPVRAVLRELNLDAARRGQNLELGARETEAVDRFWGSVLEAFGLSADHSGQIADFADGMASLHSFRSRHPAHRAWFNETCARFSSRMLGQAELAGWDGWRQAIRDQSVTVSSSLDGPGSLLAAAADVIGRVGLGGLTHRAVANHADVSLAAVVKAFPTRAALVEGTFAALKNMATAMTPNQDQQSPGSLEAGDFADGAAAAFFTPEGAPSAMVMALEELLGAAGRDVELRESLDAVRTARGETSRLSLADLRGGHALDGLDAHIYSTMVFGGFRKACTQASPRRRDWLALRLRDHCDWFTSHPSSITTPG